jgi:hypothetical protein
VPNSWDLAVIGGPRGQGRRGPSGAAAGTQVLRVAESEVGGSVIGQPGLAAGVRLMSGTREGLACGPDLD